ncbi:MAG: peptidylprolyl isomerase [Candidatus Thermoplasmatota archaeon]|nr:peptidylprolyl isomerase [Candidatus Thermoplasmatota archaeon]
MYVGLLIVVVVFAVVAFVLLQMPSPSPTNETSENPIAVFDTSMGTFQVEVFVDKAPVTAQNFIDHANSGYYNGVIFHRVMPNFMIQGGDPKGDGTGGHAAMYHEGYGDPDVPDSWVIPDEFDDTLSNVRGTISMANSGPNTGGSQFFINVVDNTYLDFNKEPLTSKHAVFGRVINGMEVVDAISEVNTGSDTKPEVDVVITSILIENQ